MKIPTETERAHLYTQLANSLDTRSAEFIVGLFPSDQDDRLATRKDLQILKGELKGELVAEINAKISQTETRLNNKIDALSNRMTGLLIAVLMTVIGAMAAVYFAP